ncbi:MAG: hypothetical protein KME26_10830 [Oscillatoria princeps RMCB-10]|nr:hypothetical protein [Oscillatoria princeps RMCB-10]
MDRLLTDLARARGRKLPPTETCWLHLLLYGFSPEAIAHRLVRSNISPELTRGIYRYVEEVTGKEVNNWAQVKLYLEEKGYKKVIVYIVVRGQDFQELESRLKQQAGIRGSIVFEEVE